MQTNFAYRARESSYHPGEFLYPLTCLNKLLIKGQQRSLFIGINIDFVIKKLKPIKHFSCFICHLKRF